MNPAIKTRVPNYIEKHLIQEFKHKNKVLYADLTIYRKQFGYGDVPVYTLDENDETEFYEYFDGEELGKIGII